ncbi:Uncharacterized protein ABC855_g2366 [[Candida] zeylanoides]
MSGKPTTPVQSPKAPKVLKMEAPSTPPSSRPKSKRLSTSYLETPEQNVDLLPFSPSRKRSSSVYRSPDYKLNSHNVQSPHGSSALKTPRPYGEEHEEQHAKMQKTPQYLPSRRLFEESFGQTSSTREDLSEISLQLKSKLSSALGKLQQAQHHGRSSGKAIGDTLAQSPQPPSVAVPKTPTTFVRSRPASMTLQRSPMESPPRLQTNMTTLDLTHPQATPFERVTIQSPDEETSAHNALIAALNRQKRRSRGSFSSPGRGARRESLTQTQSQAVVSKSAQAPAQAQAQAQSQSQSQVARPQSQPPPPLHPQARAGSPPLKLPPIQMPKDPTTEQDAVLSLMSLSSPQSVKFSHSRSHSLNTGSPVSRASSVASGGPSVQLPPISGLLNASRYKDDDDATDVENDETDDDDDE